MLIKLDRVKYLEDKILTLIVERLLNWSFVVKGNLIHISKSLAHYISKLTKRNLLIWIKYLLLRIHKVYIFIIHLAVSPLRIEHVHHLILGIHHHGLVLIVKLIWVLELVNVLWLRCCLILMHLRNKLRILFWSLVIFFHLILFVIATTCRLFELQTSCSIVAIIVGLIDTSFLRNLRRSSESCS